MKPNYPPIQRLDRESSRDMKLHDVFLNYCRRERIPVSIQMIDRSAKQGQIVGFDMSSIILEDDGRQNLLYKSAIVAINPKQPVNYIFNDANRPEWSRGYPEYTADLA